MRLPLLAVGIASVVAVLTFAGDARASDPTVGPPDEGGAEELRAAMDRVGLPSDWQAFLLATSYGESKWQNRVGLGPNDHPGRPPWVKRSKASERLQRGEARAAKRAYDRNAERYAESPYPEERYTFGSGGLFAFLPANGLAVFRGSDLINLDPWMVFDTETALVMALGYARGLMRWQQWRDSPRTWLALRVGWGNPSKMDNPEAYGRVRKKFAKHLQAIGVDPSFMDRKVPSLSELPGSAELWRQLKAGGVA